MPNSATHERASRSGSLKPRAGRAIAFVLDVAGPGAPRQQVTRTFPTVTATREFVKCDKEIQDLLELLERIQPRLDTEDALTRLMDARDDLQAERKRLYANFPNKFLTDDTGVLR